MRCSLTKKGFVSEPVKANAHCFQTVCVNFWVFSDHCLRFLCCTVQPLLMYHRLSFKPPEDCLHVYHAQCGA